MILVKFDSLSFKSYYFYNVSFSNVLSLTPDNLYKNSLNFYTFSPLILRLGLLPRHLVYNALSVELQKVVMLDGHDLRNNFTFLTIFSNRSLYNL